MNRILIPFIALAALLALAGCAKEIENTPDDRDGAAIELSSVSTDPMTKAVITGTEFTTSEAEAGIGLFLLDGSGNAYGNNGGNVRYGYSDGKWTAASPLRIGNTEGTLVGYYPYSETATNVKAIPVASSINGTDYLFGSIADLTSAKAKSECLTLSHALARLKITFKLDNSFVGSGTLSSLTIEGDGIAASGTLDATTGTVTATKSAFTVSGLSTSISTGLTEDCLVVPAAASNAPQAVTLRFTVDGKSYKVDLTDNLAVKLQSGIQTDINLTVKNTSVSIDGSSIGAWGDGGTQTVTVSGNYKVTVKLAENENLIVDDVLTNVKVDENTVKILVTSLSESYLKCTVTGDAIVSRSRSDDVFTFMISDIGSDITATIGYAEPIGVTVTSNNSDWGTASFEGECYYGETITFRATQKSGKFVEWQDADGNKLDWENPQSITLTSDITVKAVFNFSGFLPGKFTVNAQGKKVRFSRGNLWYGDHRYVDRKIPNGFYLEAEQWDGKPLRDSLWNTSHIIHFFWGDNETYSGHEQYAYWEQKTSDVLFTNKTETTPNPEFKIFEDDTEQKGMWRTLSDSEWHYILYDREMTYNKPRYTCIIQRIRIEMRLYAGTFIYPDDYNAEEVGDGKFTWQEINDAGIVFLPSTGYRDKYNVYGLNNPAGGYWSSTIVDSDATLARCVSFNGDGVLNIIDEKRSTAHCIRLVCDYVE